MQLCNSGSDAGYGMDLIRKICCFCARRPQGKKFENFHNFCDFSATFLVASLQLSAFVLGEFKILILGLDNAGKTTLLYKISSGDEVHTVPTIGYNAEEMRWKNFRLVLWDIGGQNQLRPAWNTYFSSTSVITATFRPFL